MKPIYLEFCGINSFSEPAVIDFEKLLEFGIFGIFGETGSGKSTVLDCIGFALYGAVARSRTGSLADVINYRCDRAYVRFEFEIVFEGKRRTFRAERELKRKKDAPPVQSARLYERTGGELIALAESVRDCSAAIERIVGLEQRDFEKCIALPQGEFAQFVRSARGDRVKLVARLFDLEKYGEQLTKRANANFAALASEREVLRARLEPYAEISETRLNEKRREEKRLTSDFKAREKELALAREHEKNTAALARLLEEREKLSKEMQRLEEQKECMRAMSEELERLHLAQAAVAAGKEQLIASRRWAAAEREQKEASSALARAEAEEKALPPFDAEEAEREIARLTAEQAKAESGRAARERLLSLTKERDRALSSAEELKKKLRDPHYGEQRAQLQTLLSSLPENDFFAFLEGEGREALLRGEYEIFAGELTALREKHPAVAADADPLIEKYTALSKGERASFAKLKEVFEKRENAKRSASEALLALEKAQHKFELGQRELETHLAAAKRAAEEILSLEESLKGLPSPEEVGRALEQKRRERREATERLERAQRTRMEAALASASAKERLAGAKEAKDTAEQRLKDALSDNFTSVEEAEALVRRYGDAQAAKKRVEEYREEYAAVRRRLRELAAMELSGGTAEAWKAARDALSKAEEETRSLTAALALARAEIERGEKDLAAKRSLEESFQAVSARAEIAERLKKLLEGNKFMEFVTEEYLQTVAVNASRRLLSLTNGQYFLRYNGGFFVGDNLAGGQLRPVYTLSGGETFLVSLSLALSLSAEVCAKSLRPIEFFFLDEGFGTLDGKLVDTVMDSLEKLKSENLCIGIISHVEELKSRIGRKLIAHKATERHGSTIAAE